VFGASEVPGASLFFLKYMFKHFFFKVIGSSCIDYVGFDGECLYVSYKAADVISTWLDPMDHAYIYPCTLVQFNEFLAAPSRGKFCNDHFRHGFPAVHSSFRALQFTYATMYAASDDVFTGLPQVAKLFRPVLFVSQALRRSTFQGFIQILAVVPESYPGAQAIVCDNPAVQGLFGVKLPCAVIVKAWSARMIAFSVPNMVCSIVALEDYRIVDDHINGVGTCIVDVAGPLEV
jgi:hypothetical protein